ncbi:MAG: hypothetical protein DRG24_09325 [Epsilonproteobacteria bacterium]|nr:MAG: hypothetical protein DRG24_09325 [Campylobacterota bacterium]
MQILFFLLFITFYLHAEINEENIATKAYQTNINALMVFTSQEGLNSGHYHFTDAGFKMDIYHLPFLYHLKSSYKNINFFLMGNVGYSRTMLDGVISDPSKDRLLNYDNHLRTYTGGLGGGIRYQNENGINILAGLELIYSRTGISVRQPDDDLGNAIEDFFKNKFNDNLTYKVLTQIEYRKTYEGFKPYALLSYKLYETKADFSFDALTSFTTQASVTSFGLGAETPQLYTFNQMYLTLEAYLYGHYLGGDITDVVGFDTYHTIGTVAYWNTPENINWAERFFLELSTVNSSGLEGYNIGIGFTVDF